MENHLKYSFNTKLCKNELQIKRQIMNDAHSDFGNDVVMLKNDQNFIISACNFIEDEVGKKKVDKKQLCLNTLKELFELDEEELVRIGHLIDFIHQNKLIKKYKHTRYIYKQAKKLLKHFFCEIDKRTI